ncbi:MAG: hypothetical protein MPK06_01525 [Alphaproteobacteria bacterium]|nr:hypothetical protein [Alphaproteobacteria bacterium]MDA8000294.1 hypothetical protein [Alphaproteobacteria bacterium]MDA8003400.1 hypothetical protein [Alphaproteobacteria bacterium]MDA8005209.1 hypothetical protein [Alphaproteobacteria bacterium]MDA8012807.1 hypothetical protein [Alphaproteobacteria bacterium]
MMARADGDSDGAAVVRSLALAGAESLTVNGAAMERSLALVGAESLTVNGAAMERSLALVGAESLTVNGVGSSEPHPLMPVGAADKKLIGDCPAFVDNDGDNGVDNNDDDEGGAGR